jgi:Phage integrase family
MRTVSFQDGEKLCEACGAALPAFSCTALRKHFTCENESCRKAVWLRTQLTVRVAEGEKTCEAPGCGKAIPAGLYPRRQKRFFCNETCAGRFYDAQNAVEYACAYCGATVRRRRSKAPRLAFCSYQHSGLYLKQQADLGVGPFLTILTEYFDSYAPTYYKPYSLPTIRGNLRKFLVYLNRAGLSLKDVTFRTITEFLAQCQQQGLGPASISGLLGAVSTFMNWLLSEERLQGSNPVLRGLYRHQRLKRAPRPCTEEEMNLTWGTLDERGDALSRFAVAIGEESGLRIGEVSRLRVQDADVRAQRVFVRLPNKNNRERWVPFGDKTRRYV